MNSNRELTDRYQRRSRMISFLLVCALLLIGLATIDDVGVASDEKHEMQRVYWNIRLIKTGEEIPYLYEHYGVVYHFAAEALFQVKSLIEAGALSIYYDFDSVEDVMNNSEFLGRIAIKHRFNFILSILTYLSVAGIVGVLAGREWSWLGVIVMALLPRYWGHSFFNPKDIPYATMFTLGTFAGALLVGRYLNAERGEIRLGANRITGYSLLYGVLVGLVTGTRIAGSFLLAFVGLAHLASWLGKKKGLRELLPYWSLYGVMIIAWGTMVYALHPAAWSNPFGWFIEAMLSHSSYEWEGVNLFNGQFIPANAIPWYYLPVWIGITTPVLILALFVVGAFLLLFRYFRLTAEQQACAWLVLLQMGFLPGVAVLRNSVIYDGLRQFLFILPGIAVLATVAIIWLLERIRRERFRWLALAILGLLALPTVVDMVVLHPYEYVYFNRAVGGLNDAHERYETDYYGLSMREGMEWINTNPEPGSTVVTSRPYASAETFANPKLIMKYIHEFDEKTAARPFYSIILTRYEPLLGPRFADCEEVHKVLRENTPLTKVRYCK